MDFNIKTPSLPLRAKIIGKVNKNVNINNNTIKKNNNIVKNVGILKKTNLGTPSPKRAFENRVHFEPEENRTVNFDDDDPKVYFGDEPMDPDGLNMEVYRDFVEAYTPKKEDLERKLNDDQLKELCKRVKLRVLGDRWNYVKDYENSFWRKGRLLNKSKTDINKLLVKAVMRHMKMGELYTDEEIQSRRQMEWRMRKKENLMRLDLWEYDRNKMVCESENMSSLLSSQETIIDGMSHERQNLENQEENTLNIDSQLLAAVQQGEVITKTEIEEMSDAEVVNEALTDSELENSEFIVEIPNSELLTFTNPLAALEQEQHQQKQLQPTPQFLNSEPESIADYWHVNTDSITIASEELAIGAEAEILSSYEDFNSEIPKTSTQSQKDSQNTQQESEQESQIIVD